MYEYISGDLVEIGEGHAVVDVGGVGYHVTVPTSTAADLHGHGRAQLYTALRTRDDRTILYGFGRREEREAFERLCTISGVGPGIALTILSGLPLEEFRSAVLNGHVGALQRIKGIGRKTAERIILELKEVLASDGSAPAGRGGPVVDDAVAALMALGHAPGEADRTVRKALRELPQGATLEDIIKAASRLAAR